MYIYLISVQLSLTVKKNQSLVNWLLIAGKATDVYALCLNVTTLPKQYFYILEERWPQTLCRKTPLPEMLAPNICRNSDTQTDSFYRGSPREKIPFVFVKAPLERICFAKLTTTYHFFVD